MNREGAFFDKPVAKDNCQNHRENEATDPQWHTKIVGENIGVESSRDAQYNNGQPVHSGHITLEAQLHREDNGHHATEDHSSACQAKSKGHIYPVGEALPHRGAENFDDPEPYGDFGNFTQHLFRGTSWGISL